MDLQLLEQQHQLGKPLGGYRYALLQNPVISLSFAVGGAGALLLSLIVIIAIASPGDVNLNTLKFCVAFLGIFIAIGGIGLYKARQRRGDRQIIYEQGLVDIKRGNPRVILYRDIENIFQVQTDTYYNQNIAVPLAALIGGAALQTALSSSSSSGTSSAKSFNLPGDGKSVYAYQFELRNGKHIASSHQEVGEHVKKAVLPTKLKSIAHIYQQGSVIQFGPIGLCTAGLVHRRETLPWSDLKAVEQGEFSIADGSHKLYIKRHSEGTWGSLRDTWAAIDMKAIPNFELFWVLVHQLQHDPMKLEVLEPGVSDRQ
ncbi:MAG: DUF6585 family protein [Cyanobacteria bacterium P01_H01_bin.58]